jgi:hypothetical protein
VLPLTLTVKSGTSETNYPQQNTDASGFFTVSIAALPNGTYNWRVKGPRGGGSSPDAGYLAASGVFTKTGVSQLNVEMGLQRAGDANNDNLVSSVDFNILRAAFGGTSDLRADWNNDGLVSSVDFNLLRSNFGTAGSPPLGPAGDPGGNAATPPLWRDDE